MGLWLSMEAYLPSEPHSGLHHLQDFVVGAEAVAKVLAWTVGSLLEGGDPT